MSVAFYDLCLLFMEKSEKVFVVNDRLGSTIEEEWRFLAFSSPLCIC